MSERTAYRSRIARCPSCGQGANDDGPGPAPRSATDRGAAGHDHAGYAELLLAVADEEMRSGTTARVRRTLWRAADHARVVCECSGPGQGAGLLARVALALGVIHGRKSDPDLVRLHEEAIAALGERDTGLRARVMSSLAEILHPGAAGERRASLSCAAVEVARRAGDKGAEARALAAAHPVLGEPGLLADRLKHAAKIVQLAEAGDNRETGLAGRRLQIIQLLEEGQLSLADRVIEEHHYWAERLRNPVHLFDSARFRGLRALSAGRFRETRQCIEEALAIAERAGDTVRIDWCHVQLFTLLSEQGEVAEVERITREFAVRYPLWKCFIGSLGIGGADTSDLRSEVEQFITHGVVRALRHVGWLATLAMLAETCARLHDRERAQALYGLLAPFAARNLVIGPGAVLHGPVSRSLALVAVELSRWADAEAYFEKALRASEAAGARPLIARTRYVYAAALLRRAQPGDARRARELLTAAVVSFRDLGMPLWLERALALEAETHRSPRRGRVGGSPESLQLEHPATPRGRYWFRREGQFWTIGYEGSGVTLRDSKGLRYIAQLLGRPGCAVHCLDLAGAHNGDGSAAGNRCDPGDAGPLLDERAVAAYRAERETLSAELADAERCNDLGRQVNVRRALEFLEEQLAAAVGRNGRLRVAGSAVDRARTSVWNAISRARAAIRRQHESLGCHLDRSLKTGTLCSYDPERPIPWKL